jgi:hypothetical protein
MNSFISNFKKQYRKVVFELLGFVLLFFLFDRLFFALIKKGESSFYGHISPYSLSDKFSQIKSKSDYKILIFGTSRTYDGIHPRYIQDQLGVKAFKEAFVGKGPMYNYYFYQEYKKTMGIPRIVIYGVDYFLYNITTERYWMQRFSADVINANYFDQGVSMLFANKAHFDKFCNTFLNHLQDSLWNSQNFLIEQDNTLMENYLGVDNSGDVDTQEPPRYKKVIFFQYPGREGVYFSKLMEELNRDKVTVLLLSLPDYVGTYWTNQFHGLYLRAFRYYQKKYDNVHFHDYNNFRKFDIENPAYFINGGYGRTNSHLSRSGSEILNRIFLKDLRKYLPENEVQKRR